MITAVTLNPTIDICAPLGELIPGAVSRTDSVFSYPGGKGTNTARALAKLGCAVTAAGFCGEADLASMRSFMMMNGVRPEFTPVCGENRLCLLISESVRRRETVINSESAFYVKPADRAALLKGLSSLSGRSSHVLLSGSLPLGVPASFYAAAVKAASKSSHVMLDTSSASLMLALQARPHTIKQNASELSAALKRPLGTTSGIKNAMSGVSRRYGIVNIIVTLGSKGSVLLDKGRFYFSPAVKPAKAISPVGCGDAFSAGYLYAVSNGNPPQEAMRWATAAAASNLEQFGSCFINRKDVLQYHKRASVRPYK